MATASQACKAAGAAIFCAAGCQGGGKGEPQLTVCSQRREAACRGGEAGDTGRHAVCCVGENGVNAISKEVCPTSTFTIARKVPVDGVEQVFQVVPNSLAGEMARQNPSYLGAKLKEAWLRGEGEVVRELLTPTDPMQQDAVASGPPAAGTSKPGASGAKPESGVKPGAEEITDFGDLSDFPSS